MSGNAFYKKNNKNRISLIILKFLKKLSYIKILFIYMSENITREKLKRKK